MSKVAQDTKWRTLKNFSKIYSKILEEEKEREAAAAAAAAVIAGQSKRPCLLLKEDGCLATDKGTSVLGKQSGSVSLKQQQKKKMPPHRSNSLENWDEEYALKGLSKIINIKIIRIVVQLENPH